MCHSRRARRAACLLAVAASASVGPSARAVITSTGNVIPALNAGGDANVPGTLVVGDTGFGDLAIFGPSQLSGDGAILGNAVGSSGRVFVSDVASWTLTGGLEIGDEAAGLLDLRDDTTVSAGFARIGTIGGSNGQLRIRGTGAFSSAGDFEVGASGTGTLLLESSGQVFNGYGGIGVLAGSTGTAQMSGSSTWNVTSGFTIGGDGVGSLTITGGSFSTGWADIGRSVTSGGGSGSVSLSGPAASWATGGLIVGNDEPGSLTIATGASVTANDFSVGWTGHGSLNISGGKLTTVNNGYLAIAAASSAVVNLSAGGDWTNLGPLDVGSSGAAAVTLQGNSTLSNTSGILGLNAGSSGAVTLDHSTWNSSSFLEVARSGTGYLALTNGSHLTSTSAVIGASTGSSGTVIVDDSTWAPSGFVTVGQFGAADVEIRNGASFNTPQSVTVAFQHDAALVVTGANTTATVGDFFEVGRHSHGTFSLSAAARLSVTGSNLLATDVTGSATVLVTGAGTLWQSPSVLSVGNIGTATLTVQSGASIQTASNGSTVNSALIIANQLGSTGSATFTGAGTTATLNGNLVVGSRGKGALTVSAGAVVSAQNGFIGRNVSPPNGIPATGTATITGAGSAWNLSGNLYVGGNETGPGGFGTLNVDAAANVNVGGTITVFPSGTLSINNGNLNPAGLTTVAGGTLTATSFNLPSLAVSGGTVILLPDSEAPTTSSLGTLTMTGGTFDLVNNRLILTATTATQLRPLLQTGRIISSTATADPQQRMAIGYATAADLGVTTWGNTNVNPTNVLVRLTWLGDANFNGRVDRDDFALIDRGFVRALTGWTNGDFNHDGSINAVDYMLIDRVFIQQGGPFSPDLLASRQAAFGPDYVSQLMARVPEPSIAACLLFAAPLCRRRRDPISVAATPRQ